MMLEAIEQGRRGYVMVVSPAITSFQRTYWEYICRCHPRIWMAEPKRKAGQSNWIALRGHDFPKRVWLWHKFDQKVMELGFDGRKIEEIYAAKADWPDDIRVVHKGGTASLQIRVLEIDMHRDLPGQLPAVERAMEAAYQLMPHASLLQR